jgi:hypothetical protein
MAIELKVYESGDHKCLVWLPAGAQAIPNCRGFTIHRTRKPAAGGPIEDEYCTASSGSLTTTSSMP